MAAVINNPGITHRGPSQEQEDYLLSNETILSSSRKDWPNEAGFDNLSEHRGPIALNVKGTIPSWAAGALYRTGPGRSKLEGTPSGKTHYVSHWFDGFAHTHKFDIKAGTDGATVDYSSRRTSDEYAEKVRNMGWRSSITMAQKADPCVGIYAKTMSVFQPAERKDMDYNVVVNADYPGLSRREKEGAEAVAKGQQRTGTKNIFISSDQAGIQELHPDTLETVGHTSQKRLHPELVGQLAGAHNQRDPVTGDLFNFNLKLGPKAPYRVFRTDAATGETEILATISGPDAPAAYIHSMFLTENFAILAIPSTHFGWNGLKIPWQRNLLEAINPFSEDQKTQWFVVDRRHGKGVVGRFSTPAGFFFHSINAFEETAVDENGQEQKVIFADLSAYETSDIISSFYYDVILNREDSFTKFWNDEKRRKGALANIKRFKFTLPSTPPASWSFGPEDNVPEGELLLNILNPHAGELPTINPLYNLKRNRYVYSVSYRGLGSMMDTIVKTDLETREAIMWAGGKGSQPGEPIFVAKPGGTSEDDGVLLSVVLDGENERSYLLCLDARTLEELGRAEAEFAVGCGFHGLHLPVVNETK